MDADAGAMMAGEEPPQGAVVLDPDVFFAVKVAETLTHAGYATRRARRMEQFTEALAEGGATRPVVALVNTAARGVDWQEAIRAARAAGVVVVAYGAHVDIAAQALARQAGATSVIANSKLAGDLGGIVARALRRGASVGAQVEAEAEDADAQT